jgi:hypothetical protein
MWFEVTLDQPAIISGVLATTPETTDVPASWTVSVDGKEVATGSGPIIASWEPGLGSVIHITCTSADEHWWWSITDLMVAAIDREPPVVPPVEPDDPAVTDISWHTWPEELCRQVVEGMADKWGWERKYREGADFTTGKIVVREAIIYVGQRKDGDEYTPWPFEAAPIG